MNDRRLRHLAIVTLACMAWAVVIGVVGGVWAVFEQPFPNIDSLANAAGGGE